MDAFILTPSLPDSLIVAPLLDPELASALRVELACRHAKWAVKGVYIVVTGPALLATLSSSLCDGVSVGFVLAERRSPTDIAHECFVNRDSDCAMFMDFELQLLPVGVINEVLTYQRNTGADYVIVAGLPHGVSCFVISRGFSEYLCEVAEGLPHLTVTGAVECLIAGGDPEVMPGGRFLVERFYVSAKDGMPNLRPVSGLSRAFTAHGNAAMRKVMICGAGAVTSHILDADRNVFGEWHRQVCIARTERTERNIDRIRSMLVRKDSAAESRARVLYMSAACAFSGAEQSLLQTIASIDDKRIAKSAVVPRGCLLAERLAAAGVETLCADEEFWSSSFEGLVSAMALLMNLRPDIIHVNSFVGSGVLFAARVLGIRIVQHVRIAQPLDLADQVLQADAVIAVSKFVSKQLQAFGVSDDRIWQIYNPVDPVVFDPALFDKKECREELEIPSDADVVLLIARVVPNKRVNTAIEALRDIRVKRRGTCLLLVGETNETPHYADCISRLITRLELDEHVLRIPFLSDIRKAFAAADVLILPSTNEPLGRSVLEAMAMETPAVVAKSGGSEEMIEDEVHGLVVPPNDEAALGAAVVRILEDHDLRTRLVAAAKARVLGVFHPLRIARAVERVYSSLGQKVAH